jgi:DNA-binding GntR family transcriptional regulator
VTVERYPVSQQALAELRRTILTGAIAPGSKLVVRPLAEDLGLSPTPVKAALAALEAEGLVRAVPNRGYFVQTFDAAAIREISAVRGALDRLAAELAAQAPGHATLAKQLKRNLTEQRAAVQRSDQQGYADLNHEFHQMVWESTGNRRLAEAANNLAGQVRLLVNSSVQGAGRPKQSLKEHQGILEALMAGDAERAGALALSHALHSEETLLALVGRAGA